MVTTTQRTEINSKPLCTHFCIYITACFVPTLLHALHITLISSELDHRYHAHLFTQQIQKQIIFSCTNNIELGGAESAMCQYT